MIRDDDQLRSTRDAVASLERSLAILQRDRPRLHPDRYALMAAPILDDLRRLRQEIDDYLGVTGAIQATVPLWLRLQGPEIRLENAPSSIVTAFIDILRLGVQAVAEYLERGAVGARPTAQVKQACDLRVAGWLPGSVCVGLELPELPPELFEETDLGGRARKALRIYLQVAAWAGSEEEVATLQAAFPDPEQRRLVLNQVARLVPRPRGGLDAVELLGRAVPRQRVQLQRSARERVRQAIAQTVQEETAQAEGTLREIDLDQQTFILRNLDRGDEIRCWIAPAESDLLELAKASLDHRVTVAGIRRRDPTRRQVFPLQVLEIEVLDTEADDLPAQTVPPTAS
jgi:hypothetical protein